MSRQESQSGQPSRDSPFDPFLTGFLAAVSELAGGYSFQAHGAGIADRLDVDPAFVEALTVNARRRSLIEPFYPSSHRSTVRWRVSARGEWFLGADDPPEPE